MPNLAHFNSSCCFPYQPHAPLGVLTHPARCVSHKRPKPVQPPRPIGLRYALMMVLRSDPRAMSKTYREVLTHGRSHADATNFWVLANSKILPWKFGAPNSSTMVTMISHWVTHHSFPITSMPKHCTQSHSQPYPPDVDLPHLAPAPGTNVPVELCKWRVFCTG